MTRHLLVGAGLRGWMRTLAVISCCAPLMAGAVEMQALRGHVPAATARLQPVDRLAASTRLDLAIGLPLRNREALTNMLRQVYDPASTNYHRYLTPERYAERFGPTEADYQAVIAFAQAHGLTIAGTHPNRVLLRVNGAVADIEEALHTTMRVYAHPTEARTFYAPEAEPVLELSVPVLHIGGLNNFTAPRRMNLQADPSREGVNATSHAGSGPTGSFIGNDFRAAYIPGVTLTGSGEAVGLFELDGYYASDIAAYETLAGLPNVPLNNVLVDGFGGIPTSRRRNSGNEEVALDIEMAISMAPGLSQVIVYEGDPTGTTATMDDILNRMATDNLARQLSCSWGFDIDAISQQVFLQYAAQGQSFFLASGDNGAFSGVVSQPSDDPYITVVGGTMLTTSSAHAWAAETAWDGSGGGISTLYPIPSWQQGVDMSANQGSTTMRNVPDVSMVASNVWVVADRGSSFPVLGTSIAAPLWAGFTALVNQQAAANGKPGMGFMNPALYRIGKGPNYAQAFHDIKSGNNATTSSPKRFVAATGYDLCTGWGTPAGSALIAALLEPASEPLLVTPQLGFVATGASGGPFNVTSEDYVLTNAGSVPLSWSLANTPAWLTATPDSGTLTPGGPATTVTVSLNSAASNLLLGTYTANLAFINANDATRQNLLFSLLVGNGGFETGDFTDWTFTGDANSNFPDSIDTTQLQGQSTIRGIDDSRFVHAGIYGAYLGEVSSLGSLSQTLPTVSGQKYLLSFWLDNPAVGTPNEFRAMWNGSALFDRVNMGAFAWTNAHYVVTATDTSTILEFDFRNDKSAFGLDDISLQPVAAPMFQTVTQSNGIVTLTWSAVPGLTYQVQYTADLAAIAWNNLGAPVTATDNTMTVSEPIRTDPQRLYRVTLSP